MQVVPLDRTLVLIVDQPERPTDRAEVEKGCERIGEREDFDFELNWEEEDR